MILIKHCHLNGYGDSGLKGIVRGAKSLLVNMVWLMTGRRILILALRDVVVGRLS